ncbi:MAG: hypothetical protein ACFB6S_06275 [Geminicoccaceae bacterium]
MAVPSRMILRTSLAVAVGVMAAISTHHALAQSEGPAIFRGGEGPVADDLVILRGMPPPAPEPVVEASDGFGGRALVGGPRLWIYDPDTGEVTVCRTNDAGRVGREQILCEDDIIR